MTEEKMIEESQAVVSNWTDDLVWYMQEYRNLGYDKIADIFIKTFTIQAKEIAQELRETDEEEI